MIYLTPLDYEENFRPLSFPLSDLPGSIIVSSLFLRIVV